MSQTETLLPEAPPLRVDLPPNGVLLVTVDGDAVEARSESLGRTFGNWPTTDLGGELQPSRDAVQAAVQTAVGFPLVWVGADWPEPEAAIEDQQFTFAFTRKPAPPAPEPDSQGSLRRIARASLEVDDARRVWELAKEEAANLKKDFDRRVEDLQSIIRDETTPLPLVAFANGQTAPKPDDDWRRIPLTEALSGLTTAQLAKLTEAELTTMGELADYTAVKQLSDLKGVGPAKIEAIEAATTEFWRRRNEAQPAVEPEDAPETEGEPEEDALEDA